MPYREAVRWDALFADLQAQWQAEISADSDAEVHELAEAEAAGTSFADRLRARRGSMITLRLADGSDRAGVVTDAAPEWVVLAEGERRHLVPVSAIAIAWPLAGAAPAADRVERGLGLGHVLRALGNQGQEVVVRTHGGDHAGVLVRVGRDHLDVAGSTGVMSVPWTLLLSISSA